MTAVLVLHGDHQVAPVPGPLTRQDMPADILLMQSLHDYDEGRLLRVVQTGSREFFPPCQSGIAMGVAFRLFVVVRFVTDENAASNPEERTADRRCKP